MDDESDSLFAICYPPDFPLEDLHEIAAELMADGGIVPGFIPADLGVFDLMVVEYAKLMGETIVILPDRNVVSRIASIAEGRARFPLDKPSQLAANLMAFCQCMELDFDPSIAFHELAHFEGNDVANRELAWFRAADEPQALAWVAIARGRSQSLGGPAVSKITGHDLARPLARWRRNYVAALKIAELELADRKPLERALTLLEWMVEEYFLAGPAAIFASMYFSPNAAKKRLIKQLRSADRERALAGIRNAAWDMTHVSDLSRRMRQEGDGLGRFIFATADRGLAEIARLVPIDAEPYQLEAEFARLMSIWWPEQDVLVLAGRFAKAILDVQSRPAPVGPDGIADPIGHWIDLGERKMRDWSPRELAASRL
ncbi:MAG TPA: hypothetical protein VEC11_04085 [Allosphingosinicella sp.]|nr:hypothetical protein [Allosphingosinicella sp.]